MSGATFLLGATAPPASWLDASVSSRPTAVDVQRLAGDEGGVFEIEDPVDDVADLAEPANGLEGGHALVGRVVVHGGLDDSRSDRVDPHATCCVFNGQRAGHGSQSALGEGRQRRGTLAVGVVGEAGGDVDDVAAALGDHLRGLRAV